MFQFNDLWYYGDAHHLYLPVNSYSYALEMVIRFIYIFLQFHF